LQGLDVVLRAHTARDGEALGRLHVYQHHLTRSTSFALEVKSHPERKIFFDLGGIGAAESREMTTKPFALRGRPSIGA
jgi:hypothetical protein